MTLAPLAPLPVIAAIVVLGAALLLGAALPRGGRSHGRLRLARRGLLVLLVGLVGANPIMGQRPGSSSSASSVDVVFAVDTTASSAAEDHDGSRPRLEGMREDLRRIVAGNPGARFAIVAFDRTTSVVLPLSEDAAAAEAAIDVLQPEIAAYSAGSRVDAPVEALAEVLERAEVRGRARVLVYLGDGESTAGAPDVDSFGRLRAHIEGGVVLGYGTAEGGPMRATTGTTLEPGDYLREGGEDDGDRVRSRIDEATLGDIAEATGVPYEHRSGADDEADAASLVRVARGDEEGRGAVVVSDAVDLGAYWILAIPAGLLLLLELALLVRPLRDARALTGRAR